MIKQWLIAMNLTIPGLRSSISLSRNNNAPRWALDITTCQNDKLIYIAPPLLEDGVEDNFQGDRIQLVKRSKRLASLDMSKINAEMNRQDIQRIMDQLREVKGLPKRKFDRMKIYEGVQYMPDPDVATVNGIRERNDFIDLNLNGGDSWGYFHPKSNPEILYNWKGEPTYRTCEIIPDYYAGVKRSTRKELAAEHKGMTFLAFRDFKSSMYWNGTYDANLKELRVAQAKSEGQLRAWLGEHGQPQPDDIPTWDVIYDPHRAEPLDVEKKWMNMYQPSEFEQRQLEVVTEVPPIVKRVILHALGGDDQLEMYDYFLNWCSVKVKLKVCNETSIFIQGVPGTGKGLIFNYLMRPMLGVSNTVVKRMEEMDSQFNGFLEGKQLLFVDEGEMSSFAREAILAQNFKNYITEPVISVRHMHQTAREIPNYLSVMIAANKGSVKVEFKDRRYTVGKFQEERLPITPEEVDVFKASAWPFYCYLMQYPASLQRSRIALDSAAKKTLADISANSVEVACQAIREGDWAFFDEQKPTADTQTLGNFEPRAAEKYVALVDRMKDHPNLTRDEMRILIAYACGDKIPLAPTKFSQLLKNHRIDTKSCRRGELTLKAFQVKWRT
jgi:hypothetical protein